MPVSDALAAVLAHARALPEEDVPLTGAAGRILARGVAAAVDLPPFPSSSMDGYAIRVGDTPGVLPLVGHSAAGWPAPMGLAAGAAIEISTGALQFTRPAGQPNSWARTTSFSPTPTAVVGRAAR